MTLDWSASKVLAGILLYRTPVTYGVDPTVILLSLAPAGLTVR